VKIFGREPVFWIGLIATIAIGIVSTLSGQGILSDAMAGKITDGVKALVQILTLMAPLLAGWVARKGVTPLVAPVLEIGTPVTTANGGPAQVVAGLPA
jgi:hypothetical protein